MPTKSKTKPKPKAKAQTAIAVIQEGAGISTCPPAFVGAGRHAKDLPAELLTRYAESLVDPEHLGLQPEMALCDARIASLLHRLQAETATDDDGNEIGGAGDWLAAHNAFKLLRRGLLVRDKVQQQEALLRLDTLFHRQADSRETWNEAFELVERRRKLVESEAKAQHRAGAFMKMKDVAALTDSLINVVRTEVREPETQQRIIIKLRVAWDKHSGG